MFKKKQAIRKTREASVVPNHKGSLLEQTDEDRGMKICEE